MILDEIAAKTKERVAEQKKKVPLEEMKRQALDIVARETNNGSSPYSKFLFRDNLAADGISFICEVKKASPSKGLIAPDFPYVEIAKEYEAAGASAISVLTEPFYFQGSNQFLMDIKKEVNIPLLRKDFTVDEYMIYEAKVIGASAVLLICAILDDEQLASYLQLAHELGMSALVEAHDEDEVRRAIACGAGIIGVNNRDLRTFTVDIMNSVRLRKLIPDMVPAKSSPVEESAIGSTKGSGTDTATKGSTKGSGTDTVCDVRSDIEYDRGSAPFVECSVHQKMVYVSESGIKTKEDIDRLKANGTDAVLIGETFMRSPDKKKLFAELRGE